MMEKLCPYKNDIRKCDIGFSQFSQIKLEREREETMLFTSTKQMVWNEKSKLLNKVFSLVPLDCIQKLEFGFGFIF